MKTYDLVIISLFTSILCILSPISINIFAVPFTLQSLLVLLHAYVLGPIRSTVSMLLYLLIGIMGIGVFSNYKSGIAVFKSFTGGFLYGFIVVTVLVSIITRNVTSRINLYIAFLVGTIVLFIIGTAHICLILDYSIIDALKIAVIPFITFSIIKIIIAAEVGLRIKKYIRK